MSAPEYLFDLVQGTDEWRRARMGIPTASRADVLLVKGKRPDGLGAGALTYAHELAAEILTQEPTPSADTAHTRRGHEQEPELREDAAFMMGAPVRACGFIRRGRTGYSPDGLVGDDEQVECKSHLPAKLMGMLLDPLFPVEHKPQGAFGLWVSGRRRHHVVAGYPGMPRLFRTLAAEDCAEEFATFKMAVDRLNAYVDDVLVRVNLAA